MKFYVWNFLFSVACHTQILFVFSWIRMELEAIPMLWIKSSHFIAKNMANWDVLSSHIHLEACCVAIGSQIEVNASRQFICQVYSKIVIQTALSDLQLGNNFWQKYINCALSEWIVSLSDRLHLILNRLNLGPWFRRSLACRNFCDSFWQGKRSFAVIWCTITYFQEIEYARYLGISSVIVRLKHANSPNLAQIVRKHLLSRDFPLKYIFYVTLKWILIKFLVFAANKYKSIWWIGWEQLLVDMAKFSNTIRKFETFACWLMLHTRLGRWIHLRLRNTKMAGRTGNLSNVFYLFSNYSLFAYCWIMTSFYSMMPTRQN